MKLENITLSHEHPRIDLSAGKNDSDCLLSMYDDALRALQELWIAVIMELELIGQRMN